MNINIELTDRQVEFLKQYANVYDEERKLDITADPLVVVQSQERVPCDPDYGCDGTCYVLDYEDEYDTLEELCNAIREEGLDEVAEEIEEKMSYSTSCCVGGYEIKEFDYKINWRNIAYFLTRAEAQKYVKYQRHNLTKPRVYTVYMGYSNRGDLQCLAPLLLDIGKQLNL